VPLASSAVANVLHAPVRDVKPVDKRGYRTSSADCAAPPRSTHSIRGEHRRFFSPHPPPDSPRAASNRSRVARSRAGVAADIARDGWLSPAAIGGNADSPATVSSDEPLAGRPHYNTAPTDEPDETTFRSPSRDTTAVAERVRSVAWHNQRNKLNMGPREVLLPAGQVSEASGHFPPRRLFLANDHFLKVPH
jgi:hypothetical protein